MAIFKKFGIFLFVAVAILDVTFLSLEMNSYRYFSKPFLLPILLLTVLAASADKKHPVSKTYLTIAYLAGAVGDFFLLKADSQSNFFIFGMVAFFIMQLFFALYFFRIQSPKKDNGTVNFFVAIALIAYAVALVSLLYKHLGNLQVAVSVYAGVITLMFFAAINVVHSNKASKLAIQFFIPGAGFLVLSDSILAINKFYIEEEVFNITIMVTYVLGQLFLAMGFIKHLKSSGRKGKRRSSSSGSRRSGDSQVNEELIPAE